jgi:hypothetical protein
LLNPRLASLTADFFLRRAVAVYAFVLRCGKVPGSRRKSAAILAPTIFSARSGSRIPGRSSQAERFEMLRHFLHTVARFRGAGKRAGTVRGIATCHPRYDRRFLDGAGAFYVGSGRLGEGKATVIIVRAPPAAARMTCRTARRRTCLPTCAHRNCPRRPASTWKRRCRCSPAGN